jgi:hypothetical protein
MFGFILGVIVGVFIGWKVPQPDFIKSKVDQALPGATSLLTKIVDFIKKKLGLGA